MNYTETTLAMICGLMFVIAIGAINTASLLKDIRDELRKMRDVDGL